MAEHTKGDNFMWIINLIIITIGTVAMSLASYILIQRMAWLFTGGIEKEVNKYYYEEEVRRLTSEIEAERASPEYVEYIECELGELKRLWQNQPENYTFTEHFKLKRDCFEWIAKAKD